MIGLDKAHLRGPHLMAIFGDILLKKPAASLEPPGHSLAPANGPSHARHTQFHRQRPGSAPSVPTEPAGRPRPLPPESTSGNLHNNNKNNIVHNEPDRTRSWSHLGLVIGPVVQPPPPPSSSFKRSPLHLSRFVFLFTLTRIFLVLPYSIAPVQRAKNMLISLDQSI